MNKYKLLLIFTIFLFSCEQDKRDDKLEKKEIVLNSNIEREKRLRPAPIPEKKIETHIDTEKNYSDFIVQEKLDINLDRDTHTEQFIVLTDKTKKITLLLADFYVATKDYIVAWEYELPILYNEDFTMSEQDILGIQQEYQFVVTGTTIDGNNALYIFQKSAAPKGLHIYYKNIFSYESQGSIEIDQKDRDLDYVEKRKSQGKSYDIIIEKNKMVNENTLAVTKETWIWDRRKRLFIKDNSTIEEFKINVKEKLTAIYRGSKTDFLNFINGEWYLLEKNGEVNNIIIIDSKNSQIIFKYRDGIEIFNIWRFYNYSYRRLSFRLKNNEVSTLPRRMIVTLNNTDELTIEEKNNSQWNGKYFRLGRDKKSALISNTNTDIKKASPFTGVFKNVIYSINFTYPEYKKINNANGLIEEGIYSILELSNGVNILQMRSSDNKVQNFQLNYIEQHLENQIIRTIKIHQGILTTYGIEISPETGSTKFEQTEVISNE